MRGPRRRSEIRLLRQLGMQAPDCVGQIERAVEQPAWRAVVKTFTYRVIVTTIDFGANYFVTGELTTAAGLSSLLLVAGPIAYFAHEAAWHYYGPASARQSNPLKATVHVPVAADIKTNNATGIMQSLVADRSFRHALRRMDGRRFPHPAREDSCGPA
jgi:uncharacterized membrane protein